LLSLAIRPKGKEQIHVAAIFCLHFAEILPEAKVAYSSKVYYHTPFQDPKLSITRVTATSEVCVLAQVVSW
jgi:hypothetical protein